MNPIRIVQGFLTEGGWTLWAMFALSMVLWARLIDKAFILRITLPRVRHRIQNSCGYSRSSLARSIFFELEEGMNATRTIIASLPLLGLLGTVAGMIESFDALSVFGNSNPRALSGGISHALISTMVGLVTSLAGLYVEGLVSQRIIAAQRSLPVDEDSLEPFSFTPLLFLRHRIFDGLGNRAI